MKLKMELLDGMDCRPLGRKTGVTGISARLQAHLDAAAAEVSVAGTTASPTGPNQRTAHPCSINGQTENGLA